MIETPFVVLNATEIEQAESFGWLSQRDGQTYLGEYRIIENKPLPETITKPEGDL